MNGRAIAMLAVLAVGCGGSEAPPPEKTPAAEATEYKPSTEAPSDVAAPPADAKKTKSGLAYKVLKQGKGGDKPTAAAGTGKPSSRIRCKVPKVSPPPAESPAIASARGS